MIALTLALHPDVLAQASVANMNEGERAGRELYLKYCAACHGGNGEGQKIWRQPNAQGELPAPPHNAEGHTWRHPDSDLFTMIADGWRDPFNRTKRLTMPPFIKILEPAAITDLIAFLKTMWTAEQRQFQQEETLEKDGSTQTQDME